MLKAAVLLVALSLGHAFVPASFAIRRSVALSDSPMDSVSPEDEVKMEKALKAMTAFSNKYIKNTNTKYCSDLSIPAVVIQGEHSLLATY